MGFFYDGHALRLGHGPTACCASRTSASSTSCVTPCTSCTPRASTTGRKLDRIEATALAAQVGGRARLRGAVAQALRAQVLRTSAIGSPPPGSARGSSAWRCRGGVCSRRSSGYLDGGSQRAARSVAYADRRRGRADPPACAGAPRCRAGRCGDGRRRPRRASCRRRGAVDGRRSSTCRALLRISPPRNAGGSTPSRTSASCACC